MDDLDAAECTIEEREEYEPHIAAGSVVYAGVNYEKIREKASQEANVLLWDGCNNDFPFLVPDLHIVLVGPLRADHEKTHDPGEAVLRVADKVVVTKSNSAADANVHAVTTSARAIAPNAEIAGLALGSELVAEDEAPHELIVAVDNPDLPRVIENG